MDENTIALLHFDDENEPFKDECGNEAIDKVDLPATTPNKTWVYEGIPTFFYKDTFFGKAISGSDFYFFWEKCGNQDLEIDFIVFLPEIDDDYVLTIFKVINTYIKYNGSELILSELPTGSTVRVETTVPVSANSKHHIAFVYNNDTEMINVFFDGISIYHYEYTLLKTWWREFRPWFYTKDNGVYVDEIRISNCQRWTTNFTPPVVPYGTPITESAQLKMKYRNMQESVPLFDAPHSDSYKQIFGKYADLVPVNSNVGSKFRVRHNGQVYSLMKFKIIEDVPDLLIDSVDYTGEVQQAFSTAERDDLSVSGDFSASNTGTYYIDFTPKYGYKWGDGTTISKNKSWQINKISCNASISSSSVSLDNTQSSTSVTLTYSGEGTVTAVSDDTTIATVSISGNTGNKIINIVGVGVGSCHVSVQVADDGNHYQSELLTINVEAEMLKALSECTPAEIKQIIKAGKQKKAWKVGDCTSPIKYSAMTFGTAAAHKTTMGSSNIRAFILGFVGDEVHFALARHATQDVNVAFVDRYYGYYYTQGMSGGYVYGTEFSHKMATTSSNSGGWSNSRIRNTILPKIFTALPDEWQAIITPCSKWTDNTGNKSTAEENVTETTDNLWLLSEYEVFGSQTYANPYEQEKHEQYEYFVHNSPTFFKYNSTTTACAWWLRSPVNDSNANFVISSDKSNIASLGANRSRGIVPCFVVGGV